MQFLGPLDVYVKLKDMNVSTQFTLADEKTLDFIVGHMDLLTQRLESKGYPNLVSTSDATSSGGIEKGGSAIVAAYLHKRKNQTANPASDALENAL